MKKRIFSLIFAVVFCVTLFPAISLSAFASDAPPAEAEEAHPCAADVFTDVTPDSPFHDAIDYVADAGLMNGITADTFGVQNTSTNAMAVTVLWRIEGSPVVNYAMDFTDVPEGAWFSEAVRWAASQGIIAEGTFSPDNAITKEQLASVIYSYEQYKGGGFTGSWMFRLEYADLADISEDSFEAVCWLTMNNIISADSENMYMLNPKSDVSRGEMAQIFMKYLTK